MDIHIIYMTFGNKEEARRIGKVLVEERLVACINIYDAINSLYIWDGALQDDQEISAIVKTTAANVSAVIERVKALHSYDCPCIAALSLVGGNSEFLDWIRGMVQ